jgi:hypothetical protein
VKDKNADASAAEKRKQFVADALAAREDFMRTRKAYAFEDVRKYFEARLAGKRVRKPRLRTWRI